jgi:hypothetical protein
MRTSTITSNSGAIRCSAFWRGGKSWKPLAGKSTLNRLELGDGREDRYKKITFWKQGIDELLVQVFIESQERSPEQIVLDVDTTDLPLHGLSLANS